MSLQYFAQALLRCGWRSCTARIGFSLMHNFLACLTCLGVRCGAYVSVVAYLGRHVVAQSVAWAGSERRQIVFWILATSFCRSFLGGRRAERREPLRLRTGFEVWRPLVAPPYSPEMLLPLVAEPMLLPVSGFRCPPSSLILCLRSNLSNLRSLSIIFPYTSSRSCFFATSASFSWKMRRSRPFVHRHLDVEPVCDDGGVPPPRADRTAGRLLVLLLDVLLWRRGLRGPAERAEVRQALAGVGRALHKAAFGLQRTMWWLQSFWKNRVMSNRQRCKSHNSNNNSAEARGSTSGAGGDTRGGGRRLPRAGSPDTASECGRLTRQTDGGRGGGYIQDAAGRTAGDEGGNGTKGWKAPVAQDVVRHGSR